MEQTKIEKVINNEVLEAEYNNYAAECRAAMKIVLTKIEILKDAIDRAGRINPFTNIEYRVKTFESAKRKCAGKGNALTIEDIRASVRDVGGIRIVTRYIDRIDMVIEFLENTPGIVIVNTKDYTRCPKENGYSSTHLNCQVEVFTGIGGSKLVPVEIQIRTQGMNLWASVEHEVGYRNRTLSPKAKEKLRHMAEIIREFEYEFVALRDYNEVTDTNEESSVSSVNKKDISTLQALV